jgi:hypothetical protein
MARIPTWPLPSMPRPAPRTDQRNIPRPPRMDDLYDPHTPAGYRLVRWRPREHCWRPVPPGRHHSAHDGQGNQAIKQSHCPDARGRSRPSSARDSTRKPSSQVVTSSRNPTPAQPPFSPPRRCGIPRLTQENSGDRGRRPQASHREPVADPRIRMPDQRIRSPQPEPGVVAPAAT